MSPTTRARRVFAASRCWAAAQRRYACVGDIIVVSVKEAIPNGKVKKGDVQKAVIVRTDKEIGRADGTYIRFDHNSAVLVNHAGRADRDPHLRTRGPRAARRKFMKIISLAPEVL